MSLNACTWYKWKPAGGESVNVPSSLVPITAPSRNQRYEIGPSQYTGCWEIRETSSPTKYALGVPGVGSIPLSCNRNRKNADVSLGSTENDLASGHGLTTLSTSIHCPVTLGAVSSVAANTILVNPITRLVMLVGHCAPYAAGVKFTKRV